MMSYARNAVSKNVVAVGTNAEGIVVLKLIIFVLLSVENFFPVENIGNKVRGESRYRQDGPPLDHD